MSFKIDDGELAFLTGHSGAGKSSILKLIALIERPTRGQVFINNYGAGGGVELPFGGVKQSGHGREKGFEALYGFTTLKTVAVKHG